MPGLLKSTCQCSHQTILPSRHCVCFAVGTSLSANKDSGSEVDASGVNMKGWTECLSSV